MRKTAPLAIVLALITAACESEYLDPIEPVPNGGSPQSPVSEPEVAIAPAPRIQGLVPASVQQTASNGLWSLTEFHQEELSASGEPVPPESRMPGFQVPEDGDNPPAPPLDDVVRARAELAKLEAELIGILDPILDALQKRGVTLEQMERVMGDVHAERELLGMIATEYDEILTKLARITARAQVIAQSGPRPLTRDGRGGGEQICTTDTTVDELDDGTIVIHDHESCRPGFPEDGGGDRPDGPDGPGGGGGNPGPMLMPFERECLDAGGKVELGRCQCSQGEKCASAAIYATGSIFGCAKFLPACGFTVFLWARVYWNCRQGPCDAVNRHFGL